MSFELFYKFENNSYGEGVLLNEYNEKYSLISASESRSNGTIYKKWCYPQIKDNRPSEKSIPMKIGGIQRYEMIKMLKYFLEQLEHDNQQKNSDVW